MPGHAGARARIPLVIAIVVLIAGAGWWAWTTYGEGAEDRDVLTGTVEGEEYQVAAVIAGRVVSSNATEGARVEAGDTVFHLDDEVLSLQVSQARAGLRAARAAHRQARDDDESDAQVAAARARVDQAEAALEMARVQLGYADITAPATGTVTAVAANLGEIASPGRALATISDLSSLHVSVYVPETDIGRVTIGESARVTSDGGGSWTGLVSFIAEEAEFTPNNIETKEQRVKLVYEVRIAVEMGADTGDDLRPGMPVSVSLDLTR